MKKKMFLTITLSIATLCCINSLVIYGGINTMTDNQNSSLLLLSGSTFKCIQIAFEDYSQKEDGFLKEIQFYRFTYYLNEENQIIINISVDHDFLLNKTGKRGFKGGGGEYIVDINSFDIVNKKWFK